MEAVHAHWQAASLEIAERRLQEALRHLDHATDLVLDEATASPAISYFASMLSVAYVQLEDELARRPKSPASESVQRRAAQVARIP